MFDHIPLLAVLTPPCGVQARCASGTSGDRSVLPGYQRLALWILCLPLRLRWMISGPLRSVPFGQGPLPLEERKTRSSIHRSELSLELD